MGTNLKQHMAVALLVFGIAGFGGCSTPSEETLNFTGGSAPEPMLSQTDEPNNPNGTPSEATPTLALPDGHGTGRTVRVGIPFNYPGLGLMDEKTGMPSGLEVDIAAYVVWKLGYSPYDIEWVLITTADLVPSLEEDRVDAVIAPMTITEERKQSIDFAGPYLIVGEDLLVRINDTTIKGIEDLPGKVVCTAPSSTTSKTLTERFADEVTLTYQDQYQFCVQDLIDGRVDAVATSDAILAGLAATDDFYRLVKLVGQPFREERYGVGIKKGSHNRCLQINQALTDMVDDGSWKKFIDRHIGGTFYFEDRYDNPPVLDPCE